MASTPKFELSDVRITAGQEVAFATAHGKCFGPNGRGGVEELDFRLTLGPRKSDGRWVIEHEHHSVPAT
jgi:ketosteroid isomerase-like protein